MEKTEVSGYGDSSYENPPMYNFNDQQPLTPSGPSAYDIDDQVPVIPPAQSAYRGQQPQYVTIVSTVGDQMTEVPQQQVTTVPLVQSYAKHILLACFATLCGFFGCFCGLSALVYAGHLS